MDKKDPPKQCLGQDPSKDTAELEVLESSSEDEDLVPVDEFEYTYWDLTEW